MGYEFLEDVALVDVACKVWGDTPEVLFKEAGVALVNVMIKNIDAIQENESRSLHVCGDTMELPLFNFLQEIIYYKDAETLLLVYFHLDIENTQKEWVLNCRAAGEVFDPLRDQHREFFGGCAWDHHRLERHPFRRDGLVRLCGYGCLSLHRRRFRDFQFVKKSNYSG